MPKQPIPPKPIKLVCEVCGKETKPFNGWVFIANVCKGEGIHHKWKAVYDESEGK